MWTRAAPNVSPLCYRDRARRAPTNEVCGPGLTFAAGVPRRMKWDYPEGLKAEGEYWTATGDPAVFVIAQADDVAPLVCVSAEWDDLFDITITPCMTAEEGLALGAQMQT